MRLCSTGYAILKDGWRIRQEGLFQGFDAATWMVIALQVGARVLAHLVGRVWGALMRQPGSSRRYEGARWRA